MSPTVVLDDDPTGPQSAADVPVLLGWSPAEVRAALRGHSGAHLLTNSRALAPEAAQAVTADAAGTARQAVPGCRLVLRGDSTLRGHLLEEYEAVREVAFGPVWPVLLLVPALPAAGRITLNGVHYLQADGVLVPVHTTEYARDGSFSYRTSRLLEWADQRSGGRFAAGRGRVVALEALRAHGGAAVTAALEAVAGPAGAAVAVDAETAADLAAARDGLVQAEGRGVPVVTRCAPAFAAVLIDRLAHAAVPVPAAPRGVLVVCGSYVPNSTRQLSSLRSTTGAEVVEVSLETVRARSGAGAEAESSRLAAGAAASIARRRVAVIATPRHRPGDLTDLDSGRRIAAVLAGAVARLRPMPSLVVAKGGITSATVIRDGLGVRTARVVGPVAPGISLWDCPGGPSTVVFPGNVGGPDDLTALVLAALGTSGISGARGPTGEGEPVSGTGRVPVRPGVQEGG